MTALLEVSDLSVRLPGRKHDLEAVRSVDFSVGHSEVVGIAGESGSGKTISVLALMGLLPEGGIVEGSALFEGREIIGLSTQAMQSLRGNDIAMVFQDPLNSLHPMLTIGRQLTEHQQVHRSIKKRVALDRAAELLEVVRIPDPRGSLGRYPHQFSGGMQQRIAIAMALACDPKLLIADEPTTALDVTVQAGILRLLDRLRREQQLSVVLITHDLGVLASIADRLYVLYSGRVVESGPTGPLLQHPRHPYTRGLLDALPRPEDPERPLTPIPGSSPQLADPIAGCAFHVRCPFAEDACRYVDPPLVQLAGEGRSLACPPDPLTAEVVA